MATLTIVKGSNMESRTVENIDLNNTNGRDLVEEAVTCGFLENDPNSNWFLVSNKTHQAISMEDMGKNLAELGFSDGDTIRLVSKGVAAVLIAVS